MIMCLQFVCLLCVVLIDECIQGLCSFCSQCVPLAQVVLCCDVRAGFVIIHSDVIIVCVVKVIQVMLQC